MRRALPAFAAAAVMLFALAVPARAETGVPRAWERAWPDTDFASRAVPLSEFRSGGPPRDGIPAIDDPAFEAVADSDLGPEMPVIALAVDGDARAYPLSILVWHEIVNDRVGGRPVAVTWCPLCNSAVAFDRRLDGRVLDFGTTGKLRRSDMVMYDRQTESWWQQILGEAIVGALTGKVLDRLPARIDSLDAFRERHPDGRVLVPDDPDARDYGRNPYGGYDSMSRPMLYSGGYDGPVPPMARVVAVDGRAWSLALLRQEKEIVTADGLRLRWRPGRRSALDAPDMAESRDVGLVRVARRAADGGWRDVVHDLPFAFAFRAFHPDAPIHHRGSAD